ncbi:pentatricopeptide repeat-containing protein At5g61800 [Rosa rugosa]|uniref:pentatricopeptide repeat-containing protein At5g61800 n=1 Tax=Rosa rugosa TaxID=74645 RepID=UPI002B406F6B|nr:pentatricopeptide repeat-containing protein At5g61800 [Rosa rugosa]
MISNLITLIKHCKTPKQLLQLHAHTITNATLTIPHHKILPNLLHSFISLIKPSSSAPSTTTSLSYAVSLFNLIPNPSTFCFNNIIRAHTLLSSPLPALHLFASMRLFSLPPDFHTFPFALKACAQLGSSSFSITQTLHSQALKFGFASHSFVTNTLIHVYSACQHLDHARKVFDESSHRDLVSYNAMLDAFVKGGEICRARQVFDEMADRDSVSWGTILAGYAQTNRCEEAIELFGEMIESNIRPDDICLVSALSACSQLGDLERGRSIHDYIKRNRIRLSSFFLTALVDLYAKCGCIETAIKIFESSCDKNVFTWNAMLVGLAMHGHAHLSLEYFSRMIEAGIKPDGVSLLGVLVGCSHGGRVDEARKLFDEMELVYGVPRELKHYGCMADLLGRAGLIKEAMEMIEKMPMGGDVFVWGGLLGGCKIHGDVEGAKKAAEHVMELDPEDGGVYSILASVYANAEKWDDVVKTRKSISSNKRVKKNSGCSLIRLNGVTHEFLAGDSFHPRTEAIYLVLDGLWKHQFESC